MTFNEYQRKAMRTNNTDQPHTAQLVTTAIKLPAEAGEYANKVGKWYEQHWPLDQEGLKEELGDILWYLAKAAQALDTTLDEIAQANIAKLHKRYKGDGFSVEESVNRAGSHK